MTLRPWLLALGGLLAIGPVAPAQAPPLPDSRPDLGPPVIELTLSPSPAPVPAFRNRLFPLNSERTPGDAAPVYLRLGAETLDEAMRQIREKPANWLKLSLDVFPSGEARAFLSHWSKRLRQIHFGARRATCDWAYTLPEERERAIEILLPDAQEMRSWGALVALKARVEIAEKNYDEAARTIETGLAFSRHVGEAPFVISKLVASSIAARILERVDEFVGQPDAPNLYWALTALPRPLIDFRHGFETEQKIAEWILPELDDLDRPRTEGEWAAQLARLHARMVRLWEPIFTGETPKSSRLEPDLAKFKASLAPEARAALKASRGHLDGLAEDEIPVRYLASRYREIRDERFKAFYLPYADAASLHAEANAKLGLLRDGPMAFFVVLGEGMVGAHAAQARADRKVAALRAIEAIRLQAAADGGRLPESLDKVSVVPVPVDPMYNRPFDYRREGDTAFLAAAPYTPPHPGTALEYRLKIRK